MSHDGGGFSRAPSSTGGSMVERAESVARVWGDNTWVDQETGQISEVLFPPPALPNQEFHRMRNPDLYHAREQKVVDRRINTLSSF